MGDIKKTEAEKLLKEIEENQMNTYLEIKEYKTDKVVKRIDVTGKTDRMIDKIDSGMNINLNHEKYYTVENNTKRKFKAF